MSQQSPDQLLLYRIEQVEREIKQKVASRELGLQLAPLHRELTALKVQIEAFQKDLAERDEQARIDKEAQLKWLIRGLWAFVAAIITFSGSVLLIVIQHWLG